MLNLPRWNRMISRPALTLLLLGSVLALPAMAQDTPRFGGELLFVVGAQPPSFDAHREATFAVMHPLAPHYNTLLRVDPTDPTGTKIIADLADSWTISKDGRQYSLNLRRGVKFHDGIEMTSQDVKATYDKIINPPAGVVSARKGEYVNVEAVEAPNAHNIVFRLKWPSAAFLSSLASPWNWIYKADILTKDTRWYEKNVMGTGPFTFVEYVRGSHWVGRKNPTYWDKGKPYLDGYRAIFITDPTARVAAVRSERALIEFRGFAPPERDVLVKDLGRKITVQESPWDCALWVAMNHEKKPFDDKRVRRALTLALDRYEGSKALSKIAFLRDVAGVMVPGSPFATAPAELEKLAGYSRDIENSRAEAKRLLKEAGVPTGFSFNIRNTNIPMPGEPLVIWLIDQWRQIGLNVKSDVLDNTIWFSEVRAGRYEVGLDFQCGYIVEPDLDLYKFQSREVSDANYGRYTDKVLDDLYQKQSRAINPDERKKYIREFEKRLLDEEAHYLNTIQWHRIVPHNSRVKGWTITPSHYLNGQLDRVWLAE